MHYFTCQFRSSWTHRLIAVCGLTLLGVLLLAPDTAHAAKPISDILKSDEQFFTTWNYFRSLINYVIVAGLLLVAFANILRLNVDTYGVKKVLPTLILAFFLANFSLLIIRVIYDVSESIVLTTDQIIPANSLGADSVTATLLAVLDSLKNLFQAVFADLGGGLAAGAAGFIGVQVLKSLAINPATNWIIGLFIAALLLLPLIATFLLYLMFAIRYYVVQLLVLVSPVAIMLMAFPFSRNLFNTWLKQLALWIFMRPVAYLIFAVGAIIVNPADGGPISGQLSGIVAYAVGLGATVASVTVPFQMGGWIMQGVARLAKTGLLSGRLGAAGIAQNYQGDNKFLKKTAQYTQAALYAPEQIQAAKERLEGRIKTRASAESAYSIGQTQTGDALMRSLSEEKGKEVDKKAASDKFKYIRESIRSNDDFGRIRGVHAAYVEGDRSNLYNAIGSELEQMSAEEGEALMTELLDRNSDNSDIREAVYETYKYKQDNGSLINRVRMKDSAQAKALLSTSMAGAKHVKRRDKEGNDIFEYADDRISQYVASEREEWDKANKSAQFWEESYTSATNAKTGKRYIVSEDTMAAYGSANMGDADTQNVTKGTNATSFRRIEVDTNGDKITRLDDSMIYAIAEGNYTGTNISQYERFSPEGQRALREVIATDDLDRIQTKIEARIDKVFEGKSADFIKMQKRASRAVLAGMVEYDRTDRDKNAAVKVVKQSRSLDEADQMTVNAILAKLSSRTPSGGKAVPGLIPGRKKP